MPPRFSVFIAMSLDGYIARVDGSIDWLQIVHPVDDAHGYNEFFDSIDTIVVGRATYDLVLGFDDWPYKGKRVIVLTSRPAESRHGETFVSGTANEVAASLESAKRVYVDGGNVISQFLAASLIDDLTVSVIPIILGSGIRLFPGGEGEHRLQLDRHHSSSSGLVQLRYRVTRPVQSDT